MDPSAIVSILTRPVLFGLDALTLAGFLVMGIGVNLARTRRIRPPAAYALMAAGTALVFAGIYALPR